MVKVIKVGEEDKETKVAENVTIQEPVIDEEPATTELDGYKIKQKFVKRVYYSIVFFLYFIICAYLVDAIYYVDGIDIITGEEYSFFGFILWVILMALIILPGVLIMLGFASGGVLIGVITGLTYGLLGLLARHIMRILGFDLELIFPELVGHTGVVSKPNVLGKFTSYNLSVEIEKAGLYGNSFWHGNNVAARSKGDEISVGTKVRVIEANYWSLSSLLRNSPVITVVPDE
jgi:hypothetical protein